MELSVRRHRDLLTGLLTVVILLGTGAVSAATLAGPHRLTDRFLPGDGDTATVWWQQDAHRQPAAVENALLTGADYNGAFPASLIQRAAPVPGRAPARTDWWREVIATSTFTDPAPRIRLRSIAPDGIRLHAQDWGRLGIVLAPAPIELPASAAVGDRWTDRGEAAVNRPALTRPQASRATDAATPPQRYRRDSRILAAPAGAGMGCLLTRSRTTLTAAGQPDVLWTEDETWCPGRGVVSSSGRFGVTSYRLSAAPGSAAVPPDAGLVAPSSTAPTADWTAAPLVFDSGEDTVGPLTAEFDVDAPLDGRIAVDRAGMLHAVAGNGADLVTGIGLSPTQTWLHEWSHPGGAITAVGSVGYLTVVATAERRLRAYDPYGRLRWATTLPDLAVVAPVAAGGGRLVVGTVGGEVLLLDARTGQRQWQQRLAGPIRSTPLAAGDLVAVATGTEVSVLDLADGRRRWTQDARQAYAIARAGDTVAVMTYGGVVGYRADDGRYRWQRSSNADLTTMITVADRLLVVSRSGVESVDPAGRTRWRYGGAVRAIAAAGGRIMIIDDGRVIALNPDGSVRHRWPLPAEVVADDQLLIGGSSVLAVGRTARYTLAGVRIAPAEDDP